MVNVAILGPTNYKVPDNHIKTEIESKELSSNNVGLERTEDNSTGGDNAKGSVNVITFVYTLLCVR